MYKKFSYRSDIDGLRAISVIVVVIYHAFPNFLRGGFIGVDVFFIISGFLITGILWQERNSCCFSFIEFYRRRIVRIFPALIVTLILCFLFGWFLLAPTEYKQLMKHTLAGATFTSNFIYWGESGYFDRASITKPLLHLWSLAIEEQFYILWPLIFILWRTRHLLLWVFLIVIVSFVLNILTVLENPSLDFYATWTRIWELGLGGALSLYIREKGFISSRSQWVANATSFAGLSLILLGCIFLSTQSQFPGWWALLPTFGGLLLIASSPDTYVNKKILSNKFVVYVGLISYPLYLVHWPVLSFLYILTNQTPPILWRFICVVFSVCLASFIYHFIEKKIRKIIRIDIVLMVAMVIIGMLGFIGSHNGGYKNRFEYKLSEPISGESDCYSQPVTSPCFLGDKESNKIIVIYGDSHAGHLINALNKTFGGGYKLIFFGNNCFIGAIGSETPKVWGLTDAQCRLKQIQMKGLIGANIYAVIRAQRWSIYDSVTADGIKNLMFEAFSASKLKPEKIIIVGSVPKISSLNCQIAGKFSFIRKMLCGENVTDISVEKFFKSETANLPKSKNVYFIHPIDYLCESSCQIVDEHKQIFYDDNHLTVDGAMKLMPAFEAILKP